MPACQSVSERSGSSRHQQPLRHPQPVANLRAHGAAGRGRRLSRVQLAPQVLDCRPHLVAGPRRPVGVLRQPRCPGAAPRGDDPDGQSVRSRTAGTGPGISSSRRPTAARSRPSSAARRSRSRPCRDLNVVLPRSPHWFSRSPRPLLFDTPSSARARMPGTRRPRTLWSSVPGPTATRARWLGLGKPGPSASGVSSGRVDKRMRPLSCDVFNPFATTNDSQFRMNCSQGSDGHPVCPPLQDERQV